MKITRRQLRRLMEAYVADVAGTSIAPKTGAEMGIFPPESMNFKGRIEKLIEVGINAVGDYNFQLYNQYQPAKHKESLKHLFSNLNDEESIVQGVDLGMQLDLFERDVPALEKLALQAIFAAQDYQGLISDITDYLKNSRTDSIYYTNSNWNPQEPLMPKDFVDLLIKESLKLYLRMYENFIEEGQFDHGNWGRSMGGYPGMSWLNLNYIATGNQSQAGQWNQNMIRIIMQPIYDEEQMNAGITSEQQIDPKQAYIEGDNPFVVMKFTIGCDHEGSEDMYGVAWEELMGVIDDEYAVFVTTQKEIDGYGGNEYESTFIVVAGTLSEYEVTSVSELNDWLEKRIFEAENRFSSDGFNRPCGMSYDQYQEEVLYTNIKELGEVILAVASERGYGAKQVEALRSLIASDQSSNEYYREELAAVMAIYSDMLGFTTDLEDSIVNETGISIDDFFNQ